MQGSLIQSILSLTKVFVKDLFSQHVHMKTSVLILFLAEKCNELL